MDLIDRIRADLGNLKGDERKRLKAAWMFCVLTERNARAITSDTIRRRSRPRVEKTITVEWRGRRRRYTYTESSDRVERWVPFWSALSDDELDGAYQYLKPVA